MFKINKRAQRKILSVWNVLAWLILVAIIVVSMSIFNNFSTDARISEARILNQKIIDCIVEDNGDLIENLDKSFSIYESCGVKRKLFEEEFLISARIKISELDEQNLNSTLYFGNPDMTFLCDLTGKAKPSNCFKEIIFANDRTETKTYQITVLTASSNDGKIIK